MSLLLKHLKVISEDYSMNETNWTKIYVLENPDFPNECYVGSSKQKYLCKRYYRHRKEFEGGNRSYGKLFTTPNHRITAIELNSDLDTTDVLRQRERFYYDKVKAEGKNVIIMCLGRRQRRRRRRRHFLTIKHTSGESQQKTPSFSRKSCLLSLFNFLFFF